MDLDKILIKSNLLDEENLIPQEKFQKLINKKTYHYTKNSTVTYILIPPRHSKPFLFSLIKKKLIKQGFSYIQYDFVPNFLNPNIEATKENFLNLKKVIGDDMDEWVKKHSTEHFVIVGLSLGCVIASMISGINSRIKGVIFVAPGNSLARALWKGLKTAETKNVIKKEGVTLTSLDLFWKKLAPEMYIHNLKDKKVKIFLSKSDKVIPYYLGKKFANEVREVVPDIVVKENKNLGHYGTILNFCFISKDLEV